MTVLRLINIKRNNHKMAGGVKYENINSSRRLFLPTPHLTYKIVPKQEPVLKVFNEQLR